MLSLSHNKRRIDSICISTLADDVVFALGAYRKQQEFDEDKIDLGIELCEAILRGEKIKPEDMKLDEISDYEIYKIIKDNSEELKMKDYDISVLREKTDQVGKMLLDIKRNVSITSEAVKEIQKYFIAISAPFWKENISLFRQRKISRGLQVND